MMASGTAPWLTGPPTPPGRGSATVSSPPPGVRGDAEGRDPSKAIVVFGSGRRKGDDCNCGASEAQGARVEVLTGGLDEHWRGLDRAIRSRPGGRGAAHARCRALARLASECGGPRRRSRGGGGGRRARPGRVRTAALPGFAQAVARSYPLLGGRPTASLFAARSYEAVGGFDFETVPLDHSAAAARPARAGARGGCGGPPATSPGLEPPGSSGQFPPPMAAPRARGGLLWRRARAMGGSSGWWWPGRRGLLPLCHIPRPA